MTRGGRLLSGLLILIGLSGSSARASSRLVSFYTGISNTNDLLDLVQFKFGETEPYPIFGASYSESLYDASRFYGLYWAGHLVVHFETLGLLEGDALLNFWWKWFPWNRWVPTSLKLGEGISIATGYPSSEVVSQGIRSAFLNYLFVGLSFSSNSMPEWSLDFLIHHRSGIYGLVNGVSGGSNYLCVGISRSLE